MICLAVSTALAFLRAVRFCRLQVDAPDEVDAIVVVAGTSDDRYVYARALAESGVRGRILVFQPPSASGQYAVALKSYCASSPALQGTVGRS